MDISAQFIMILNKVGVTKYRAAIDLGTSATQISKIEAGRQPNVMLINRMIEIYGINPMYLLQGKGEMYLSEYRNKLGIEDDDLQGVPRENLKLKVDPASKTVALAEEPASYEKESTIRLDIKLKGNKIISVNQIEVSKSGASPDKNKEAIIELTKLVTSNMPSSKK